MCKHSRARRRHFSARAGVTAARIAAADAFAANVRPIIREIQKSGVNSLRGVAKALSARGVKTARGGEWSAVQVSDILERLGDHPFEAGAARVDIKTTALSL